MPFLYFPLILLAIPGGTEWILILLVVLLFFGGKKIPGLMRGLGQSVREFNEAREGGKKAKKDAADEPAKDDVKENTADSAQ